MFMIVEAGTTSSQELLYTVKQLSLSAQDLLPTALKLV